MSNDDQAGRADPLTAELSDMLLKLNQRLGTAGLLLTVVEAQEVTIGGKSKIKVQTHTISVANEAMMPLPNVMMLAADGLKQDAMSRLKLTPEPETMN